MWLAVLLACIGVTAANEIDICNQKEICAFHSRERNCFCDSECLDYDDCCIDAKSRGQVISREFFCKDLFPLGGVFLIGKCPSSWKKDSRIKEECESSSALRSDTFFNLPVTNTRTGRIYRNYQCAVCNYENDLLLSFWRSSMQCKTSSLFQNHSSPEVATELLNASSEAILMHNITWQRCSLVHMPSIRHNIRYCFPNVVEDCPSLDNDTSIRDQCLNHMALKVSHANTIYRNEYCAICNGVEESDLTCSVNVRTEGYLKDTTQVAPYSLDEFECSRGNSRNLYLASHFNVTCKAKFFYNYPEEKKFMNYIYNRYIYFFYQYIKWYDIILNVKTNATYILCDHQQRGEDSDDQISFLYKRDDNAESLFCQEVDLEVGEKLMVNDLGVRILSRNLLFRKTAFVLIKDEEGNLVVSAAMLLNAIKPVPAMFAICLSTFLMIVLIIICLSMHVISFLCYTGNKIIFDYNVFFLVLSYLIACAFTLFTDPRFLEPVSCYYSGKLMYFWVMAYLTWLTIIGFDVMRSIRASVTKLTTPADEMEWGKFFVYCLYGYGIPASLIGLMVGLDAFLPPGTKYKPNFGHNRCWIGNVKARLFFFIVPFFTVIALIVFFFVYIAIMIVSNRTKNSKSPRRSSVLNISNLKERLMLFAKLACLVGVTRILYVISDQFDERDNSIYLKIIFKWSDNLMGLFILHFTGKYRFYQIIKALALWIKCQLEKLRK